jgi:hypothetical protein
MCESSDILEQKPRIIINPHSWTNEQKITVRLSPFCKPEDLTKQDYIFSRVRKRATITSQRLSACPHVTGLPL